MSVRATSFAAFAGATPALAAMQEAPVGAQGFIPGVTVETQTNIVLSVGVVLILFFARRGVLALVNRRVEDSGIRYRWAKVTANVGFVVAAISLWLVWFTALTNLGTFLGLLSAGLAIALKDLVADLAGWAFIVWRRPFDVGDRIQIGEHSGDVVDRRIFQFTIMEIGNWVDADQSTGRLIHMPNAKLFTEPLANYTAGFPYLWNELRVLITFESDWRRAKRLLGELTAEYTIDITREASAPQPSGEERFNIRRGKRTPAVYTSVEDSGVLLTVRYLCRPRQRRGTAGDLWEAILDTIAAEPAIALAYPTQRVNLAREALASPPRAPGADVSAPPPE